MTRVIGLSGSLRAGSYNSALLRAAVELAPAGLAIEIATIRGIPLYDGDVEAGSGLPETVAKLKEVVAMADGLLLVSPEYNNGVPGVFKNAIDWLSRPASDIERVFGRLPVGLIGATPGRGGTRLAQTAWLPVLRTLGTNLYGERMIALGSAGQAFDATGRLVDEAERKRLARYLEGFGAFVTTNRRSR